MTEYIFDVPDSNQPIAGESALYYPDERDEPMAVGEEIVRCRDCDNLNIVGKCPCGFFAMENLDGFCAWGATRKEGGE